MEEIRDRDSSRGIGIVNGRVKVGIGDGRERVGIGDG